MPPSVKRQTPSIRFMAVGFMRIWWKEALSWKGNYRSRLTSYVLPLPSHVPNGYVSGTPTAVSAGSGETACVSSTQTYSSNWRGRHASK